MTLVVVRAGARTTVQDLGRPGQAHVGVPRSGAVDRRSFLLANRLVGNDPSAAGLEAALGGLTLRMTRATTIAVTGAPCPVTVDGRAAAFAQPVAVPAGATVRVGRPAAGLRVYVAVAGGIAVEPVLGSRSTDTLSGLGPPVLTDGVSLPLGVPSGLPPGVDVGWWPRVPPALTLRLWPGPRDDWFTAAGMATLLGGAYTMSTLTDRVGARLTGPPVERARAGELPSEGVVLGAVQVPANGLPLVFLADHPTTGGYPVIGVVDPADLDDLAQARPGTSVRFAPA